MCDEIGLDPVEADYKTKRMRDWGEFCVREHDPAIRTTVYEKLFGKGYELPVFDPPKKRPNCDRCGDSGFFFSETCTPRDKNYHRRSGMGWVVCECYAGNARNNCIAELGRKKPTERKRPPREEF